MPIYEFICECGYKNDYYLSIGKRDKEIHCPICNKIMQKLIGIGSLFNLKGENWFKKGLQ